MASNAEDWLEVTFPNVAPAEMTRLAGELEKTLTQAAPGVTVERRRSDSDALDLGAIVAILIGSAAATKIAIGLERFIGKLGIARVDFHLNGKVVIRNVTSADAAKIVQSLAHAKVFKK